MTDHDALRRKVDVITKVLGKPNEALAGSSPPKPAKSTTNLPEDTHRHRAWCRGRMQPPHCDTELASPVWTFDSPGPRAWIPGNPWTRDYKVVISDRPAEMSREETQASELLTRGHKAFRDVFGGRIYHSVVDLHLQTLFTYIDLGARA
jgi:hypothetical protein